MARFRAWFTQSVLIAVIASLAAVSYGRLVAMAYDASAAETITHVENWINTHPKDAEGYRVLAHIHALAWAYGDKISIAGRLRPGSLPRFSEDTTVFVSRTAPRARYWSSKTVPSGDRKDRPVTTDDANHLAASIAAYRKAVELNAGDALSELGLGWMLAQEGIYARELLADSFGEQKATDAEKASWAQAVKQLADKDYKVRNAASKALLAAMPKCAVMLRDVKSKDMEVKVRIDAVLQGHSELQALSHYRKAYALRSRMDLEGQPSYQVDSQVSARAGAQILAVLWRHPKAARKGEVKAVRDVVDKLAKKRHELMMRPQ